MEWEVVWNEMWNETNEIVKEKLVVIVKFVVLRTNYFNDELPRTTVDLPQLEKISLFVHPIF